MIKLFDYYISGHDTDFFRYVSPTSYLKIAESASFAVIEGAGLEVQRMIDEMESTWMTASAHLEICEDIYSVGNIQVYGGPLKINGVLLTVEVRMFRDRKLIARCDVNTMAVNYRTRKVIRPTEILDHFHLPYEQGAGAMARIILPEDMKLADVISVRYSDCDHNQHLRAVDYTDFVCDVAGYWSGRKRKKARHLYIEYLGECKVGTSLYLYRGEDTGGIYVRGAHADGRNAFKAYLITE